MERCIQIHKYMHADDARVNMLEQHNHKYYFYVSLSHQGESWQLKLQPLLHHFSHRFTVMMLYVNKFPYQKC